MEKPDREKDIRIQKELYNIDKSIHDMYIDMFECKCTDDMLCREFIDVMSKYELNKYLNLEHLSFEQKEWVFVKLKSEY
jgi:hypothetical protein